MFGNSMPTSVGAAAASAATSVVRFMRRALYSARKASWDWRTGVEKREGKCNVYFFKKYLLGPQPSEKAAKGLGFRHPSIQYDGEEKRVVLYYG